jgi:HlyD family secretion protein
MGMRKNIKWLILAGVVALVGVFVALGFNAKPQDQNFTAKVERGDIYDVVEATGTINAVITVQVGSQVSGVITKLYVDFNSRVHKGEIVALIDPALFEGAVLQASADLDNAKANRDAARANLEKARASFVQSKADFDRAAQLTAQNIISKQQLDLARANYDSMNASVSAAVANVTQAEAQISQKAAALRVAQTNLNYTVIRSPIDGTVVARNVDVGQTVAASLQAPTIFTIAQDLSKMLVYTKTDESDVGNIKPGKHVNFKVDAFPKENFHGTVTQVRMNPTIVQNVVTYDTMIEFDNPQLKLFPGMTAYVTIPVAAVQNVLKLPNTALRYKPPMTPEEVLRLYEQYGVDEKPTEGPEKPPQPVGAPESSIARVSHATSAVVWKLHPDNTMEPVKVSLGITDHAFTEVGGVLKGSLKETDNVVVRSISSTPPAPGTVRR